MTLPRRLEADSGSIALDRRPALHAARGWEASTLVQPRSLVVDEKLIFVLGVQRSGTTALLESLGQDPSLRVEDESPCNELYDRYALRPEPEIRDVLWRTPKRVLLKPLANLFEATVEELLAQFADYGSMAVFLYRDPVFVWQSTMRTFQVDDSELTAWLDRWRRIHRGLLLALAGPFRRRIALVRYEDLMRSRGVFRPLCRFLRVSPSNAVFWRARANARPHALSKEAVERILLETSEILSEMDSARTFAPSRAAVPLERAGDAAATAGGVDEIEVELLGRSPEPWRLRFGGAIRTGASAAPRATVVARSPDGLEASFGLGRGPLALEGFHARKTARLESNWRTVALQADQPVEDADMRFFVEWDVRPGVVEFQPPQILRIDPAARPASSPDPLDDSELDARLQIRMGPTPSSPAAAPTESALRLYRRTIRVSSDDPLHRDARFAVVLGGGELLLYFRPFRDAPAAPLPPSSWKSSNDRAARLVESLSDAEWIRCERTSVSEAGERCQIWREGFPLSAGRRYSIRIRLKADDRRSVGVGVSQAAEPWTDLGFFRTFDVGPEWSDFYYEFVPLSDCENARVLVDLSEGGVPVEVEDVAVEAEVDRWDDEFLRRASAILEKLRLD